ncbi:fructose PTS transporter subunit IIA [soil metagenome]
MSADPGAPRAQGLVNAGLVDLDLDATVHDKHTALRRLVRLAGSGGRVSDEHQLLADVRARERQLPTGLEGGIGLPHARSSGVLAPTLVFGRSARGVDFGAADGPARLVFLLVAPDDGGGQHLTVLAALARRLVRESFRDDLLDAPTPDAAAELLRGAVEAQ